MEAPFLSSLNAHPTQRALWHYGECSSRLLRQNEALRLIPDLLFQKRLSTWWIFHYEPLIVGSLSPVSLWTLGPFHPMWKAVSSETHFNTSQNKQHQEGGRCTEPFSNPNENGFWVIHLASICPAFKNNELLIWIGSAPLVFLLP